MWTWEWLTSCCIAWHHGSDGTPCNRVSHHISSHQVTCVTTKQTTTRQQEREATRRSTKCHMVLSLCVKTITLVDHFITTSIKFRFIEEPHFHVNLKLYTTHMAPCCAEYWYKMKTLNRTQYSHCRNVLRDSEDMLWLCWFFKSSMSVWMSRLIRVAFHRDASCTLERDRLHPKVCVWGCVWVWNYALSLYR